MAMTCDGSMIGLFDCVAGKNEIQNNDCEVESSCTYTILSYLIKLQLQNPL